MILEHAPANRRGFYASFVQIGYPLGFLLATGIFALVLKLSGSAFLEWAWRIPFLFSIFLIAFGIFIRSKLPETPVFEKIQKNKNVSRFPFLNILKNEKKPLFLGIGIKVTEIAWAYLLSVFFPLWAVNNLGLNRADVMDVVLIAVACTTIVIPLSGYISDIIGRRKIYIFTSILFGLLAYPIWASLAAGNIFWPIVVGIISSTIMLAPLAALLPELFRPETRYSGAGATNQIAAAIGGGIVPVVGTWLAVTTGHLSGIAILMIILSLITLGCSLLIKETYRKNLF